MTDDLHNLQDNVNRTLGNADAAMNGPGPTDLTEDANDAIRRLSQECQHLVARLNEAEANAAAWQTRANTLDLVIAAHHDTMQAQQAHLDTVQAAWERDQRRLEWLETPRLLTGVDGMTSEDMPVAREFQVVDDGRDG